MITGQAGEILSAPLESLIFTLKYLKKKKIIDVNVQQEVITLIKKYKYYDKVMPEVLKLISRKDLEYFYKKFSPENRTHRFTDDAVAMTATEDVLLIKAGGSSASWSELFTEAYHSWCNRYPEAGYGGMFRDWLKSDNPQPYNSYGNGGAMRVAPVAYYSNDIDVVREIARQSCMVTHNHDEGVCGGMALAEAVFLARTGASKDAIRQGITEQYGYDLNKTIAEFGPSYQFKVEAAESVPEAIICFLESKDAKSALENVFTVCGDIDTIAIQTGSIADASYGYENIPQEYIELVNKYHSPEMLLTHERFAKRFIRN
jgi:ADP-ribosyl-[dinitrogen reductase] hydrolase